MRNALVLTPIVLALAACGGSSTKASKDCFQIWNDTSNQRRQIIIAGLFTVADVTTTSDTCGYIFHTEKRAFAINAKRNGSSVRRDELPTIGDWSAQQQEAVHDNAAVDSQGLVRRR